MSRADLETQLVLFDKWLAEQEGWECDVNESDAFIIWQAALSSQAPAVQQEPVAYVRANELEKLKSPMLAGCGMMLSKESGNGRVALYTSPLPALGDAEDAARYRFLRDSAIMGYPSCEGADRKDAYLVVTGYGWNDDPSIVDEAVDSAIDAARKVNP